MSVSDSKIARNGHTAKKHLVFSIPATSNSQTALKVDGTIPGYKFRVLGVEVMCTGVTAVGTVDVKIGTTSVLASVITPVANTPTAGTLSATDASLKGTATDTLFIHYTTDGSGVITNGRVRVTIRPRPLHGENEGS